MIQVPREFNFPPKDKTTTKKDLSLTGSKNFIKSGVRKKNKRKREAEEVSVSKRKGKENFAG